MSKVYHVELKEPIEGKKHFYFGSQVAIFDYFSPDRLGISYRTLTNKYDLRRRPYENEFCIIRFGKLRRRKTNRGPRPRLFFHI